MNFHIRWYNSPIQVDEKLFEIRDENDYIILHTAIIEEVDILITGDKDFKAVNIEKPEICTPSEFLEKYQYVNIERVIFMSKLEKKTSI